MQKWCAEKTTDKTVFFAAVAKNEKTADIIKEVKTQIAQKITEKASFKLTLFNAKIVGVWTISVTPEKAATSSVGCEWRAEAKNNLVFSALSQKERHADVLQEAKDFITSKIEEKTCFRITVFIDGIKKDAWTIAVYPLTYEGRYVVCGGSQGWIYKKVKDQYLRLCTNLYNKVSWNTPIRSIEHRVEFASDSLDDTIDYLQRVGRQKESQDLKLLEEDPKRNKGG